MNAGTRKQRKIDGLLENDLIDKLPSPGKEALLGHSWNALETLYSLMNDAD